jgi:Rrf2 family transcriptional regulator, iron-sulfur cluster assembly transcription factor
MLTQAVGYASVALGHVAAAGGKPVLVKEIAEAAGIPGPYLAKIIHSLGRKGLVTTQRGVGGGVTLARPPAEITLYELCVALDDPAVEARCMLGVAQCTDERACPAHRFWATQRGKQIEYLQSMTVADVAAFETRRRWKLFSAGPSNGAALNGNGHDADNAEDNGNGSVNIMRQQASSLRTGNGVHAVSTDMNGDNTPN